MAANPSKLLRTDSEAFGAIQLGLYHETPEDAARALAEAYVGPEGRGVKALAHRLRPVWPVDKAHRWFLNALNTERDEKLEGSDWLALLRIGREQGIHTLAHHLMTEAGYEYRVLSGEEAAKRQKRARVSALLAELARLTGDEE